MSAEETENTISERPDPVQEEYESVDKKEGSTEAATRQASTLKRQTEDQECKEAPEQKKKREAQIIGAHEVPENDWKKGDSVEATTSQASTLGRSAKYQEGGEAGPERKKKKEAQKLDAHDPTDDIPMNIPFEIRNGVRHLSPYWTVYRTRAKGRWFGRKLVDCFTQEFLSLNPNYAALACRLGRIWVNGKQMRDVDYVFQSNDRVEHWGHRHEHPVLDVPIRVVADTDSLLVIDKPPSLPVHACGQYAVHTILGQLRERHGMNGLRVLHRLDRTTSGILLFAKDYETDREFKKTLKEGEWSKEYICKVDGVFPQEEMVVDQPIGTLVISMGIQCVRPDGKTAVTRFRRLWTDGRQSVLRASIETGRTHQIRVHAQYLGYPIVNDDVYNRDVWGEKRGKGAEYGKSFDELCEDVKKAHRASHWHETLNPEYEKRMERMAKQDDASLEMPVDPEDMTRAQRPAYDPLCLSCNVVKKEVPWDHFQIFLHCLKYETSKWCYSTPMPEWAIEPDPNAKKD